MDMNDVGKAAELSDLNTKHSALERLPARLWRDAPVAVNSAHFSTRASRLR